MILNDPFNQLLLLTQLFKLFAHLIDLIVNWLFSIMIKGQFQVYLY